MIHHCGVSLSEQQTADLSWHTHPHQTLYWLHSAYISTLLAYINHAIECISTYYDYTAYISILLTILHILTYYDYTAHINILWLYCILLTGLHIRHVIDYTVHILIVLQVHWLILLTTLCVYVSPALSPVWSLHKSGLTWSFRLMWSRRHDCHHFSWSLSSTPASSIWTFSPTEPEPGFLSVRKGGGETVKMRWCMF